MFVESVEEPIDYHRDTFSNAVTALGLLGVPPPRADGDCRISTEEDCNGINVRVAAG